MKFEKKMKETTKNVIYVHFFHQKRKIYEKIPLKSLKFP